MTKTRKPRRRVLPLRMTEAEWLEIDALATELKVTRSALARRLLTIGKPLLRARMTRKPRDL